MRRRSGGWIEGLAAALLVLASALGACGGGDGPAAAAQAAYDAANEMDYAAANVHLSAALVGAFERAIAAGGERVGVGGIEDVWRNETRDGRIEEIEVLGEEVDGQRATVRLRIAYEDGSRPATRPGTEELAAPEAYWFLREVGHPDPGGPTREVEAEMIREDGRWKFALDSRRN